MLGVFLSLLELVKTQQVVVAQAATSEPITVALREDRDPSLLHFPLDEELPGQDAVQEEDEPHPPTRPLPEEEDGDDTSLDLAASDADSIVSPFMPQADEAKGA